jgi:hypothetical protein
MKGNINVNIILNNISNISLITNYTNLLKFLSTNYNKYILKNYNNLKNILIKID